MKYIPGILGAAALLASFTFSTQAQDEGGEAAAADVGGAAAEAPEAPAAPVKPRPAEIMPLTPKNLLLDIVRAGDGFVAVGDRGGIITSPDGKNWTQAPVPVRAALTSVAFADAQHGWAVGHDAAIVATTDGGKSWTLQNFAPQLEKPLLDVLFIDASTGFTVGAYGLFLKTTDGGASWAEVEAPSIRAEEVHFNALVKLGDGSLFVAGESGMLAVSSDQGQTWTKLTSPYESSLFGALPVGDKGALIYGLRGNVYIAQDVRANKWTKLETQSVASMFGGATLADGRLAMVGLNGVVLLATADGKVTTKQTPTGTPLSAAVAMDGGLLAVGESGVQPIP
ncbi:MAG TPA: YCF48-related protein [Verrucomicrobiae bacterium]|nr:YCF48-related protein [Verrucomicrobiae bacterium]